MKLKKGIVILFSFIFLLALLIYEGNIYCYNRNLEKNFTPNREIPLYPAIWKELYKTKPVPDWYLNKEEITEKEMEVYYAAWTADVGTLLTLSSGIGFDTFVLEQDLHYYSEPDIHSEVKIIKKGTPVYINSYQALAPYFPDEYWRVGMLSQISGSHTFPSYDKNWRRAIPYFTIEELEYLGQPELPEIKAYYLPLKELLTSIKAFQKQYEQFCKEKGIKSYKYGLKPFFRSDQMLYTHGWYLSPNLYKPSYIKWIGLGIGLAGIFLIGIFVLQKNRLKKFQEENRI